MLTLSGCRKGNLIDPTSGGANPTILVSAASDP